MDYKVGTLLKLDNESEEIFTLQYLGKSSSKGCFLGKVIKSSGKMSCYPVGSISERWLNFLYIPIKKSKRIIEYNSQHDALKEVEETFKSKFEDKIYKIDYRKHLIGESWTILMWKGIEIKGIGTIIQKDMKWLVRIELF